MGGDDYGGTHRQFVRLAHDVFREHPEEHDAGELLEHLKRKCSRVGIRYANTGDVARALDAALWQRYHL